MMNTFELAQKVEAFAKKYEPHKMEGMDWTPRAQTVRWWKDPDGTMKLQQAWAIPGVAWIWLDVPTDDESSPP